MDQLTMFSADWWQQPLGSWMAWNRVSIAFFLYIFGSIAVMGLWEYRSPGGNPRKGIFTLDTTLWGAVALSIIWIVFVFRYA
jgi:predicted small integral membrane protein